MSWHVIDAQSVADAESKLDYTPVWLNLVDLAVIVSGTCYGNVLPLQQLLSNTSDEFFVIKRSGPALFQLGITPIKIKRGHCNWLLASVKLQNQIVQF